MALLTEAHMHLNRNTMGGVVVVAMLTASACSSSKSIEDGNSPAGDYSYCGALTATCNAFYTGTPTACSQAARNECSTFQPTHSLAFRNAVVSCAKSFSPCIKSFYDCIDDLSASATPTAAQARVKADFCAACPDKPGTGTVGPCSTFFSKSATAGPGIYGLGLGVLKVSDTIAAEIGSKCVAAAVSGGGGGSSSGGVGGGGGSAAPGACEALAFGACENMVVKDRTTPSACHSNGG